MNKEAFYKISYGLYIVSSCKESKNNGFICNTVFQTTSEPQTIAICSNKQNLTTDYIISSKLFSVSIIQQEVDLKYVGLFGFKSGKDTDKFKDITYVTGKSGVPVVTDKILSYFECEVINTVDLGTHLLFVAKILDAEVLKEGEPLTYHYYRNVIKGFSPKTAPTYISKDTPKT